MILVLFFYCALLKPTAECMKILILESFIEGHKGVRIDETKSIIRISGNKMVFYVL